MKVLFPIGTIFPSQHGGPSNTVYWMAKALHSEGVSVTIVSTDLGIKKNEVKCNEWLQTDFGIVYYSTNKLARLPFKLLYLSIKELKSADILHLNSIFYPPSWIIAIMSMFIGKPKIVWSIRGNLEQKALNYSPWKKKIIIFLISNFLKKGVVFHSTSELETKNARAILGNGIDIVELPNYLELPQLLVKPKFNQEKYFLYIGRLHPIKALENLLQAIALSNKFRESDFIFKIAGEGDSNYKDKLEAQITSLGLKDKVKFIGVYKGEEKQALYANAFFTFLVSHNENFGNVIIESLAQATPSVASTGTPWEILEKRKAGFWVKNTPQSLANTIDTILQMKPETYKIYCQNALNLVKDYFDVEKNICTWIKTYSNLVNEKTVNSKYLHQNT